MDQEEAGGVEVSSSGRVSEVLLGCLQRRGLFEKEVLKMFVAFWPEVRQCPEMKGSYRICLLP